MGMEDIKLKLEEIKENTKKEIKETVKSEFNAAAEGVFKESKKMYDSYIDQYYSYKTKRYRRHETNRTGTGDGWTLYFGQQFKKWKSRDGIVEYNFDINASEWEENGWSYKEDDPATIVDNVISGIRGVPQAKKPYRSMSWSGEYSGKYFSYSGKTMQEVFDDLLNQSSQIVYDVAMPIVRKRTKVTAKNMQKEILSVLGLT